MEWDGVGEGAEGENMVPETWEVSQPKRSTVFNYTISTLQRAPHCIL